MCVEIKINLLIISILVIGEKYVVKNLDIFKDIFFLMVFILKKICKRGICEVSSLVIFIFCFLVIINNINMINKMKKCSYKF